MSQILEQPKQLLRKFSDILRNTKFKQCYGQEASIWYDHNNEILSEQRCAIGVLMTEYFGWNYEDRDIDGDNIGRKTILSNELRNMLYKHNVYGGDLIHLNDNERLTFPQIADFLESKGL